VPILALKFGIALLGINIWQIVKRDLLKFQKRYSQDSFKKVKQLNNN
jgi:hypothetical protein